MVTVRRGRILTIAPALAADVLMTRLRGGGAALGSLTSPRRRTERGLPATRMRRSTPAAPCPTTPSATPPPGPRPAAIRAIRGASPVVAPGRREADCALRAFNRAFWVGSARAGAYYRQRRRAWRLASFWQTAELIEMVEDVVESTGDPATRRALRALWRGVLLRYGRVWTRRRAFNDDVMWMVIAAVRAYRLTGTADYLTLARANFDAAMNRGWSKDLGGGLWWTTARREKNACVNGPAAVAACLLFQDLRNPSYLAAGEHLYGWLRSRLWDGESGRVGDRIELADDGRGIVRPDASTYNQGTFIGAADLLCRITGDPAYNSDALRALAYTRNDLAPGGILRGEGDDGDGGGFKGIFARYAVKLVRHNRLDDYDEWLWRNAQAAWERRDARGLVPQDWTADLTRPAGGPTAWDASSAVVLLQVLNDRRG
jgi:predicted alpha-1,6-mannanase (GH76 family)